MSRYQKICVIGMSHFLRFKLSRFTEEAEPLYRYTANPDSSLRWGLAPRQFKRQSGSGLHAANSVGRE